MPADEDTLCQACRVQPATHFNFHCAHRSVSQRADPDTGGQEISPPVMDEPAATRSTRFCHDCYLKQASPEELAHEKALEDGCSYCGAPASSGPPLGTRHREGRGASVTCQSCATAALDFLTSVLGSPDEQKALIGSPEKFTNMFFEHRAELEEKINGVEAYLRARRKRYAKEGYSFVCDVVCAQAQNLSAAELLDALRLVAIEKFGANAREQLRRWGITRCEDFGEIIFRLVEEHLLGAEPDEKREDFGSGYSFQSAFPVS